MYEYIFTHLHSQIYIIFTRIVAQALNKIQWLFEASAYLGLYLFETCAYSLSHMLWGLTCSFRCITSRYA